MIERSTLKQHADLMDRMATRLGVDLQEAAIGGDISVDELTDAVLRCTSCPNPDACKKWLDDGDATQAGEATATPNYCSNGSIMATLRDSR